MIGNKTIFISTILVTSPMLYYYYATIVDKKIKDLENKINLLNNRYNELYDNYAYIIDIFNQTQLKMFLDDNNKEKNNEEENDNENDNEIDNSLLF